MDIYSFIRSKDVAEHCRNIGKTWNTCEMAIIIARIFTSFEKALANVQQEWALEPTGWHLDETSKTYDITNLDEEKYKGSTFYKQRWIKEDDPPAIIAVNHRRWEIEECFRIMKHEFKARPVYLSHDDRISAHFMTCFISLLIYRILEKKLDEKFTCQQIIDGLRSMNFHQIPGEGYIPSYTRTNFTDALHEVFGFRTDYQIMTSSQMKKIFKETKK